MFQESYRPPTQFSVFPPVIKNLLFLNVLVFMVQLVESTNLLFTRWFALWPIGVNFWPWQLLTYGFLHGGFSHLFFNLLALWMFGVRTENAWGSQRFGLYYFACVIGAGLLQLLVALVTGEVYPTVGASGGVFGLLLAFGMMYPDEPIYLYFFVPVKAKWFVIGYGVLELYAGFTGSMPGVAHFAHLGGMLFGFLMLQYWRGKLPFQPRQRMYW
jgi:membrane associated rhomboid family serine protease